MSPVHRYSVERCPGRCRHSHLPKLLVIAAVLTYAMQTAQGFGPHDRRLNSTRVGISIEAPNGWTLSQHTGYADAIVLLLHPDGSRISVSAAKTKAHSAEELLDQNGRGLAAQGLTSTKATTRVAGAVAIDLAGPAGSERMRQLYTVRAIPEGHQAVVLTLIAPAKVFATRTAALDFVAARLSFDDPAPSSTERLTGKGGAGGAARP